jgi:hypothetical protein
MISGKEIDTHIPVYSQKKRLRKSTHKKTRKGEKPEEVNS